MWIHGILASSPRPLSLKPETRVAYDVSWPLSTRPGLDRHGGDGILWRPLNHSIAIGKINVGLAFFIEKPDNLEALKNQGPTLTEHPFPFFRLTHNANRTDLTTGQ